MRSRPSHADRFGSTTHFIIVPGNREPSRAAPGSACSPPPLRVHLLPRALSLVETLARRVRRQPRATSAGITPRRQSPHALGQRRWQLPHAHSRRRHRRPHAPGRQRRRPHAPSWHQLRPKSPNDDFQRPQASLCLANASAI
jgi:hypothetical protein